MRWSILFALAACTKPPPPLEGDAALVQQLHAALTQGGDLTRCTDPLLVPKAELVSRMDRLRAMQDQHPSAVTDIGWQALLADLQSEYAPPRMTERWRPLAPRLGNGRCARIEGRAAEVPQALRVVPAAVENWPAVGEAVRREVATRGPTARAAWWRCEGGGEVRVVTAQVASGTARTIVAVE